MTQARSRKLEATLGSPLLMMKMVQITGSLSIQFVGFYFKAISCSSDLTRDGMIMILSSVAMLIKTLRLCGFLCGCRLMGDSEGYR